MSILTLWTSGDNTVGIPPLTTDIQLSFDIPWEDKRARGSIANSFITIFKELWDCGPIYFLYDDQCFECKSKLLNNKCTNPLCFNSKE